MSSNNSYWESARAYADGVRVLFAPTGQVSGERGGRGPESYPDLANQAESLAQLSTRFTGDAVERLAEATAEERMELETALLAKTLSDLEVSSYLLQAAQNEETEVDFESDRRLERGASSTEIVESYLELLLGGEASDPARVDRLARGPRNLEEARVELKLRAGDALTLISERASVSGKTTIEGIISLGLSDVARAFAVIGLDIAKALGQAEKVTRLYNLFRDFLVNVFDSLKGLLGPKATDSIGGQLREWVEEVKGGITVNDLLEKLYGTEQTKAELSLLILESKEPLEPFVIAIDEVGGINHAFQKKINLIEQILPRLKYLTLLPAAVLPQGTLLLAAGYVIMGGYVILVGGDYVDARNLVKLDRVPGVRQVVESHLARG